MSSLDLDAPVSRAGTHAVKYDERLAKFGREDVLPLWVADMDLPAPPFITEALTARAAHPMYGYTMATASLREAIASWQRRRHGWSISPEHVLLTSSVGLMLGLCLQTFTEPGEGVVVQPPVWNPLFELPARNDRAVILNPLRLDDAGRHHMDLDALARQLAGGEGARMLWLCNPHNPTGNAWGRETLEALGALCEAHDLLIVSDEIHADLVYGDRRHVPLASLSTAMAARTITLSSPAKTFNVPGLSVAYAIVEDDALRHRLEEAMARLHLGPPNLFGLLATELVYQRGEPWLAALMAHLERNIHRVLDFATTQPLLRATAPDATFLIWLDLRALGLPGEALQRALVAAGLGMTPGHQFGAGGDGFMRMNIAAPGATIDEALARLARAIAAHT